MKSKLLRDIGENKEYLDEIVANTIELKKIEILEKSGDIMSKIIIGALLSLIAFIVFVLLAVLAIVSLAKIFASYPMAILATVGFMIILATCIYILRGILIKKPMIRFFNNLILKNI